MRGFSSNSIVLNSKDDGKAASVVELLPPDDELQYPVGALDEDEGFLSAAIEGGAVDVDELVADSQLLTQGSFPPVLDLSGRRDKKGALAVMGLRDRERDRGRERANRGAFTLGEEVTGIFEKEGKKSRRTTL